jgi:hypothetical protein
MFSTRRALGPFTQQTKPKDTGPSSISTRPSSVPDIPKPISPPSSAIAPSMGASMDYLSDLGNGPDWGSGNGMSHEGEPFNVPPEGMGQGSPGGAGMLPTPAPPGPRTADEGWSGHPMLDDPQWTANRQAGTFHRLRISR